jgi:hypothetical protein
MDLDKTPPTYLERIDQLEEDVATLRVVVTSLVPAKESHWYDDLGCVLLLLIVCSTIVLLTMIDNGAFK